MMGLIRTLKNLAKKVLTIFFILTFLACITTTLITWAVVASGNNVLWVFGGEAITFILGLAILR